MTILYLTNTVKELILLKFSDVIFPIFNIVILSIFYIILTSCCKFVNNSVLAICISLGGSDCRLSTNRLKAKQTLSTLFWSYKIK